MMGRGCRFPTCSAFSVRKSPTNHSTLDGSPLGSSRKPRNTMVRLAGVPLMRRVESCTKRQLGSVWFSLREFCKFFLQRGCNLPVVDNNWCFVALEVDSAVAAVRADVATRTHLQIQPGHRGPRRVRSLPMMSHSQHRRLAARPIASVT